MLRGVLLFLAGALVGANVVYFVMSRQAVGPTAAPLSAVMEVSRQPLPVEPLTPGDVPPVILTPDIERSFADPVGPEKESGETVRDPAVPALIVPVRGVTREQLSNTYEDARGSGRVHEAIDIMADHGTPVLAVADGKVEKLFSSDRGGLTIYQFEPTGRYAYYYAHLDRYADDLDEGDTLKQGDVIGYVGSTGNASDDGPHLHFGIFELTPERQWWKGTAINPYPALQAR